jgi:hypothetical protein
LEAIWRGGSLLEGRGKMPQNQFLRIYQKKIIKSKLFLSSQQLSISDKPAPGRPFLEKLFLDNSPRCANFCSKIL